LSFDCPMRRSAFSIHRMRFAFNAIRRPDSSEDGQRVIFGSEWLAVNDIQGEQHRRWPSRAVRISSLGTDTRATTGVAKGSWHGGVGQVPYGTA
jgi:hypothetical protein